MPAPNRSRRLILVRHAKSSWKDAALDDADRPLNARGKRDAVTIGAALADLGWEPDVVYTSPARRTRQTWKRLRRAFDRDIPVVVVDRFYLGGLADIRDAAADWPADLGTALVLGHNPGWEDALQELLADRSRHDLLMTTGNAALLIGAGATFAEALAGPWRCAGILRPRELAQ